MKTDAFDDVEFYEDFPGCCGISVTHNFPPIEDVETSGRQATKSEILDDMREQFGEPNNHLNLIALTDGQLEEGWLYVVQKAGFRRLSRFRNNEHGNIVNLFGHVKPDGVPPYKGRAKTKFGYWGPRS